MTIHKFSAPIEQQSSQGGRVMRQTREEESLAKAEKKKMGAIAVSKPSSMSKPSKGSKGLPINKGYK
jgi:hypothetical protein